MFGLPEIKNLEDLVGRYIEKEKKIVETRVVGVARKNSGSTVLEVDVIVKDESRYTQEVFSVAAKVIHQISYSQKVLNIDVQFKSEVKFYEVVIPLLVNFQRERGIKDPFEYFPKFYGARLNVDGEGDKIDHNAVIILEQLSRNGRNHTISLISKLFAR